MGFVYYNELWRTSNHIWSKRLEAFQIYTPSESVVMKTQIYVWLCKQLSTQRVNFFRGYHQKSKMQVWTKIADEFSFYNRVTSYKICLDTKPVFVARIEASIFVFDTMPVLYWPVLGQIQFCSFDRRCKTCLDTKPILYQDRFCSLTNVPYTHDW